MRQLLILFILAINCLAVDAQNRTTDSTSIKSLQLDTMKVELLHRISEHTAPLYKLYPTENMWTFLELETFSGRIWQVQYSMESNKRFKTVLNSTDYVYLYDDDESEAFAGRFELHKTLNTYNFLLLDTYTGRVWQIQWSLDSNKRGVVEQIR